MRWAPRLRRWCSSVYRKCDGNLIAFMTLFMRDYYCNHGCCASIRSQIKFAVHGLVSGWRTLRGHPSNPGTFRANYTFFGSFSTVEFMKYLLNITSFSSRSRFRFAWHLFGLIKTGGCFRINRPTYLVLYGTLDERLWVLQRVCEWWKIEKWKTNKNNISEVDCARTQRGEHKQYINTIYKYKYYVQPVNQLFYAPVKTVFIHLFAHVNEEPTKQYKNK